MSNIITKDFIDEDDVVIIELSKSKRRALRRKNNYCKASRKRKIALNVNGITYDNLHQYSKNKIHCSCPLCSFNHKKKTRVYSMSERKRMDDMNYQLKLYNAG